MQDVLTVQQQSNLGLLGTLPRYPKKPDETAGDAKKIPWVRTLPFATMHIMCLGVLWVGWSWIAVGVALLLYGVRMFAITAFYHRYFSHKAYKTSRFWQFMFGVVGCAAVQRGPLWWASNHRHHHVHSDDQEDVHSPAQHGFWYSHLGWFLSNGAAITNWRLIPDLTKFPELRLLEKFEKVVPLLVGIGLFYLGVLLNLLWPGLNTSGPQMLIWGFFVSTVLVYHNTYLVNSLAHLIGTRPYATKDDSRNNFFIALVTFGEGWHNNHHHYAASARQGFLWWEIDFSYYMLVLMSWFGIVWDLKPVPKRILAARRKKKPKVAAQNTK
jgi:stearoyl-CoA desaturase (delta-9 desaturase)